MTQHQPNPDETLANRHERIDILTRRLEILSRMKARIGQKPNTWKTQLRILLLQLATSNERHLLLTAAVKFPATAIVGDPGTPELIRKPVDHYTPERTLAEILDPPTLEQLAREWMQWSPRAFPKTDALSCLDKLQEELEELRFELTLAIKPFPMSSPERVLEEYVDVFLCLLSSMALQGVTIEQFKRGLRNKTKTNYAREWTENPGGKTYSHKKD
jgi:hypothetical protein